MKTEKAILTIAVVAVWAMCGHVIAANWMEWGDIEGHLLYPFFHANVWHLAANVLFLWLMPCEVRLRVTFAVAVLASFLPSPTVWEVIQLGEPADTLMTAGKAAGTMTGGNAPGTVGMSGVLFAAVGITWGQVGRFRDMFVRNKWVLILTAVVPNVNFLIHLYCLLGGYLYGKLCAKRYVTL